MASIQRDGDALRLGCDVPRCRDKRRAHNQDKDRFLAGVVWGDGTMTLSIKCKECGENHSVTLLVPVEVMQQAV